MSYPFQRLVSDLRTRYPSPPDSTPSGHADGLMDDPGDDAFERRMNHLPKEVGAFLVAIGVVGLLLPGPVGSPFVVAGGLVLWPRGFSKVERWFARRFPAVHRSGVTQIDRYLTDMERRYPGSTGDAAAPRA